MLLERSDLFEIISAAKKERIDKQYFIASKEGILQVKGATQELLLKAEDFLTDIKLITKKIDDERIKELRGAFKKL